MADNPETTEDAKIAASLDAAKRARWPYVDRPRPGEPPSASMAPAPPPRPPMTPLQSAAVMFVACMAEDVDARRGMHVPNGTRETQAKVIEAVRRNCFGVEQNTP